MAEEITIEECELNGHSVKLTMTRAEAGKTFTVHYDDRVFGQESFLPNASDVMVRAMCEALEPKTSAEWKRLLRETGNMPHCPAETHGPAVKVHGKELEIIPIHQMRFRLETNRDGKPVLLAGVFAQDGYFQDVTVEISRLPKQPTSIPELISFIINPLNREAVSGLD